MIVGALAMPASTLHFRRRVRPRKVEKLLSRRQRVCSANVSTSRHIHPGSVAERRKVPPRRYLHVLTERGCRVCDPMVGVDVLRRWLSTGGVGRARRRRRRGLEVSEERIIAKGSLHCLLHPAKCFQEPAEGSVAPLVDESHRGFDRSAKEELHLLYDVGLIPAELRNPLSKCRE